MNGHGCWSARQKSESPTANEFFFSLGPLIFQLHMHMCCIYGQSTYGQSTDRVFSSAVVWARLGLMRSYSTVGPKGTLWRLRFRVCSGIWSSIPCSIASCRNVTLYALYGLRFPHRITKCHDGLCVFTCMRHRELLLHGDQGNQGG